MSCGAAAGQVYRNVPFDARYELYLEPHASPSGFGHLKLLEREKGVSNQAAWVCQATAEQLRDAQRWEPA